MKPLAIFGLVGAAVMIALTVQGIREGRIWFQLWIDERSKAPFGFWSSVALYLLVALGFLLLAAKETFFPNWFMPRFLG